MAIAWSGLSKTAAPGTSRITPQQGSKAFAYLLEQNLTSVLVWPVDWQTLASNANDKQPLLEELL